MLYEEEYHTRSTYFILPMTFFPNDYFYEPFVNCYIRDAAKPTYKEHIFVVLDEHKDTNNIVLHARTMSNYKEDYRIGRFTIIVYKVMPLYKEDYNKFIEGRYSEFSEKYKDIISNYYSEYILDKKTKLEKRSIVFTAIKPLEDDKLKLSKLLNVPIYSIKEMHSKPKIEDETLTILNLIKTMKQ